MASIGKVVLLPKGTYNAATTYNRLDFVVHNGSSWVSKIDNNKGNTPTEGDKWQLLAQRGIDGEVSGIPWGDDDNPSTSKIYSSSKVDELISDIGEVVINDTTASTTTVYSSSKVDELLEGAGGGGVTIDDITAASDKVYSSSKINTLFDNFKIDVDSALSSTSENPVQNKVINSKISDIETNMGTLKFKIDSGVAKYSKDGGSSWVNFRNPVGTATADKVLTGNTFANSDSDSISGTMVNNGAITKSLTSQNESYTIPEGYHNGSGIVTATYTKGVSYCFRTHSGVTSVSNFDISSFCNSIKTTYGITIDPSTLTSSNFIIGNIRDISLVKSDNHREGSDGVAPYDVAQAVSLVSPHITYSSNKLNVSVGTANGYAIINTNYSWGQSANITFDVYLVLIKTL